MRTFHVSIDTLVQDLHRLERKGLYEEAFDQVSEVWNDFSRIPDVEDLEPDLAAEFLLRYGSLIGFLGQTKQVKNSQEQSKNILTIARDRFLNLFDFEKAAECSNYLTIAYLRTGEFLEARVWLDQAFSDNTSTLNDVYAYSLILESLVLQAEERNEEVIEKYGKLEKFFLDKADYLYLGCFYNNFGISYKRLGKVKEAIEKYELAKYYHQKSDHQIYLGTISNNLANLYRTEKKFKVAHKSVDAAINSFKRIKDRTREAVSVDTKASIYFDQRKYEDALETINKGILILEKGDNKGYLVESYQTKVNILIELDEIPNALEVLFEAYKTSKEYISEEFGKKLLLDFEKKLKEKSSIRVKGIFDEKEIFDENYELIFHKSIKVKGEFNGIKIKNNYFENYGLRKGVLAVTVKEKINKGDLVAVLEKENNLVVCGFYDYEFGIICLDNKIDEPQLFNKEDIELLGKIIGYCEIEERTSGKILVNPINL
jgi:tetratricopeptide (TPR) repeat protein